MITLSHPLIFNDDVIYGDVICACGRWFNEISDEYQQLTRIEVFSVFSLMEVWEAFRG